jgi:hypothetical protein
MSERWYPLLDRRDARRVYRSMTADDRDWVQTMQGAPGLGIRDAVSYVVWQKEHMSGSASSITYVESSAMTPSTIEVV